MLSSKFSYLYFETTDINKEYDEQYNIKPNLSILLCELKRSIQTWSFD